MILLMTLSAIGYASACNTNFGVDLTNLPQENGIVTLNNITYTPEFIHVENGTTIGCVCDITSCARKCCPFGEYMNGTACAPGGNNFSLSGDFYVVVGNRCKKPKHVRTVLYPNEFVLQDSGQLFINISTPGRRNFGVEYYCVDYIGDEDDVKALVCLSEKSVAPSNISGMIISMPFLFLTFLIYALLPEPNLHAKSLMCYVMALFWAYLLLIFIEVNIADLANDVSCKTIGVFCLFFFMISFVWMNVMSIDIYWTFSGHRGFTGNTKQKERKRFLLYNAYALGLPLIISVIVAALILDTSIPNDAWYHPGIGKGQCWFTPGLPRLIFFYGPLSILISVNIILFIITAWKVNEMQRATAILRNNQTENRRSGSEADKNEFYLYLKLMLAMGINWSMEIISWAISWQVGTVPPAVWYFTDFCNAIYGVFIFFVFVFKRSIWNVVKKRFSQIRGKLHLSGNTPSTAESSLSEKGNVVVSPQENHRHATTAL